MNHLRKESLMRSSEEIDWPHSQHLNLVDFSCNKAKLWNSCNKENFRRRRNWPTDAPNAECVTELRMKRIEGSNIEDPDPLRFPLRIHLRWHWFGSGHIGSGSALDPDPLFPTVDPRIRFWINYSHMWIRIRIYVKLRWIRNAGGKG